MQLRLAPLATFGWVLVGTTTSALTHLLAAAERWQYPPGGALGRAIGEAFQITSDEVLTWNQIAETLATAAGAEFRPAHIASDAIARELPEHGPALLGDKAHSVIFDNSKVKSLVPEFRAVIPFWRGAREMVAWHDADASRRVVSAELDAAFDRLVERYA